MLVEELSSLNVNLQSLPNGFVQTTIKTPAQLLEFFLCAIQYVGGAFIAVIAIRLSSKQHLESPARTI